MLQCIVICLAIPYGRTENRCGTGSKAFNRNKSLKQNITFILIEIAATIVVYVEQRPHIWK